MPNELAIIEDQLKPLTPNFEQAIGGIMPVDRLLRTALVSIEKNPDLLQCSRQSLFNSIMSAAVLALEVDGVTGQAFLIPYAKKAQLVIGYKGYNTLGARAGLTITGEVVCEADAFDYELGTSAFVKHKAALSNRGRVIAAWSAASALDRPPIVSVLGIDELLSIKNRSPGAKRKDSPWNDPAIGFAAMCSKSAKRRLCRSLPLNVMQLAARMDEAFEEQGHTSHITEDRNLVIEGEIVSPIHAAEPSETPSAETLTTPQQRQPIGDPISRIKADGIKAAGKGLPELERWWHDLLPVHQKSLKSYLEETLKPIAAQETAAAA